MRVLVVNESPQPLGAEMKGKFTVCNYAPRILKGAPRMTPWKGDFPLKPAAPTPKSSQAGWAGRTQQRARCVLRMQARSRDQEMLVGSPVMVEQQSLLQSAGWPMCVWYAKGELEAGRPGWEWWLHGGLPLSYQGTPKKTWLCPVVAVARIRWVLPATCWKGQVMYIQECNWISSSDVTFMQNS